MEVKKSQSADLEGKKSTGMLIGYVLILAAILVAFEWTQREMKAVEVEPVFSAAFEEDMIPIMPRQEIQAPPPAAAPKVTEILKIVEDDTELVEEEVETTEEVNQTIVANVGTGPAVATGPVGPVVEEVDEDRIFEVAEQNPQFPGGDDALLAWLGKNIKYPQICQEQGVQGRVYASFVVNKDGSIVDIKIMRSPDPAMSKEAERVLKIMPRWVPGKQGGKPVRVKFSVPIMFRLN